MISARERRTRVQEEMRVAFRMQVGNQTLRTAKHKLKEESVRVWTGFILIVDEFSGDCCEPGNEPSCFLEWLADPLVCG
jgi:hypothetical protein